MQQVDSPKLTRVTECRTRQPEAKAQRGCLTSLRASARQADAACLLLYGLRRFCPDVYRASAPLPPLQHTCTYRS